MSYILDALKKLESEKERKARGGGMINIAGELLKNGPAPPKERRNWPLVLGLVLLASLITFGATFLFLHGGQGKKRRHHAVSSPVAVPPPVASIPVPAPKPPMPAPPGPPAVASPRQAAPLPVPKPVVVKTSPVPRHPRVVKPARPATVAKKSAKAPVEPAKAAAASLVTAPADIKVSGIAWQDHRAASRAVVNGFLLREGDTVSGARIVEIFQNRIRFSSAAGTFEVYLVANGVPGPAK